MTLSIHQVRLAPPKTVAWLQALFAPVIAASRLQAPPPIELRAMGAWGGVCRSMSFDTDGRVCLSQLALHWSRQSLVIVYVHETCHRLLCWAPGDDDGHDGAFAALLHCLLSRCDRASVTDGAALSVGLYDLADTPSMLVDESDAGAGRSMAWAVSTSNELSPSDISAEELAVEIRHRYNVWLDQLAQEPFQAARARAAVAARVQTVSTLREKLFVQNALVVGLCMLVVVMLGLMIKGAGS